jgi:menaquinone-dependent protoporphyrinogen oxidase
MSGMSILVAYATRSGATRTLAETIASTVEEEGEEATLADVAEGPDPTEFDAVVLGSAVRIESFEKSAVAWARDHLTVLAARPFAVFSCSGSASDPAKGGRQKATDAFLDGLGFAPAAVKNFPGWVLLEKIPLHERVLLTSLRTPTGDFRDLPAVADWAREILPRLRG